MITPPSSPPPTNLSVCNESDLRTVPLTPQPPTPTARNSPTLPLIPETSTWRGRYCQKLLLCGGCTLLAAGPPLIFFGCIGYINCSKDLDSCDKKIANAYLISGGSIIGLVALLALRRFGGSCLNSLRAKISACCKPNQTQEDYQAV